MPLAAAVVGAAVIGGGASVIASNKASKTAKKTAAANNLLQTQTRDANLAVLSPYVNAGAPATNSVQALLGLSGKPAQDAAFSTFQASPGYNFRIAEGNKSVAAALGKRGQLESGAGDRAAISYGQNMASDEYGRWFGALQQQQNVGLTAAAANAGVSTGAANAITANNNNAANTQANAALSNASSINGALASGVSAYALSAGMKSSYSPSTFQGIY